jgi:hypothetical protein
MPVAFRELRRDRRTARGLAEGVEDDQLGGGRGHQRGDVRSGSDAVLFVEDVDL